MGELQHPEREHAARIEHLQTVVEPLLRDKFYSGSQIIKILHGWGERASGSDVREVVYRVTQKFAEAGDVGEREKATAEDVDVQISLGIQQQLEAFIQEITVGRELSDTTLEIMANGRGIPAQLADITAARERIKEKERATQEEFTPQKPPEEIPPQDSEEQTVFPMTFQYPVIERMRPRRKPALIAAAKEIYEKKVHENRLHTAQFDENIRLLIEELGTKTSNTTIAAVLRSKGIVTVPSSVRKARERLKSTQQGHEITGTEKNTLTEALRYLRRGYGSNFIMQHFNLTSEQISILLRTTLSKKDI